MRLVTTMERHAYNRQREIQPGEHFGKWTVLRRLRREEQKDSAAAYLCRCVCGREVPVPGHRLLSGRSKGCSFSHKQVPTGQVKVYRIGEW